MDIYTTSEAAAYLGLKKTGFLRHANAKNEDGTLRITYTRKGRYRMYTREALDAFQATRRGPGRPKGGRVNND